MKKIIALIDAIITAIVWIGIIIFAKKDEDIGKSKSALKGTLKAHPKHK